jgi:hypothetical protein
MSSAEPVAVVDDRLTDLPAAVHAWRTWKLRVAPATGRAVLIPIGGDRHAWTPRRPMRARCPRHRSHRAPDPGCSCGLYAVKDAGLLRAARDPAVIGTVDLWGMIVEHERGFRGAFAYPQRLGLICPFCFWQRGAGRAEVDHVARSRRRRLVPMCNEHLDRARIVGYRVFELWEPAAVLDALLGAYAVDRIDRDLVSRLTAPDSGPRGGTADTPRR